MSGFTKKVLISKNRKIDLKIFIFYLLMDIFRKDLSPVKLICIRISNEILFANYDCNYTRSLYVPIFYCVVLG